MSIRKSVQVIATFLLLAAPAILPLWLDSSLPGKLPAPRVLLNMLPLAIVAGMFLGATRRPLLSLLLLLGLVNAVFFVNGVKVAELQEPLVFNDFLLLPQVITGFELLGSYVETGPLLVATALFTALCFIGWKWERPIIGWPAGLVLLLLSTVSFASLDSSEHPLGSLYHSRIVIPLDWEARENVATNGLVTTLVRSSSRILYDLPDVDPAAIKPPEFLTKVPPGSGTKPDDLADIILVLSESFFDPAVLGQIEPCEYLTRWCDLKSGGSAGWLAVPTYGGNTTRSEFELLTSVPYATFGGVDYPYVSVVNRPIFSIPWHLKSKGYRTTAIHTHFRTFWRRHSALPRLGFDRYIAIEDMGTVERLGFWPMDSVLTDQVLATLESAESNQPQFVFAISMENHGPWNANRLARLPDTVSEIALPEAADQIPAKPLQQFLFHAENALTELERLWRFVQQRPEKTLLIFFGDHLPGLNASFDALGFDNGKAAYEQLTPYLVLSNFPLRNAPPEQMPIYQLMPQVLASAGQPLGPHYRDLQAAYAQDRSVLDSGAQQALDAYIEQLQISLLHVPTP